MVLGGIKRPDSPPCRLLGGWTCDLDRIRMKLPGTSMERFERSRRRFCSLRSAFRVTDVNSPLQALELVSVGAEQILEEVDVVRGHHTPITLLIAFQLR
jgi:hypothetical protein